MNQPDYSQKVGIVVPTIGGRPQYLPSALKSIREAGDAFVVLVGKKGFDASEFLSEGLIDLYADEQGPNLAEKINYGFQLLPGGIRYINWLGDDDLLTPGSLDVAKDRLDAADQPVLVYGGCEYIDPEGKPIFTNKSGGWAVLLLRFGPQLIPQPGSLYRRDAFDRIGGLNPKFGMAFDFDLFYNLSEVGKATFMPQVLAKFRWHPGSLSVSRRKQSVDEASRVRKSHLPWFIRPLSELWEFPVRLATRLAGAVTTRKLNRH